MKKSWNLIFVLLLVFAVCPSTHGKEDILSLDAAIKTTAKEISGSFNSGARIAVVKFESPATRLGDYIMEELNGALIQDKRLLVVDRANIEYLEKELQYQKENISEEAAKNIGKWLGAELIVVGSLDNIGDTYRYRVYTINVAKAAREAATMLSITNDNSFKSLLSGLQNNSNTVAIRSYGGTSNNAPAKSAGDYLNTGITFGIKGDFTNAIASFDQAIKLDPNFALAYLQRGKALIASISHISSIEENFEDINNVFVIGETTSNEKMVVADRSINDFSQAIRIERNNAKAYYQRGSAYFIKGDYNKAQADYYQAVKINPNYATAYNRIGLVFNHTGEYDKAIVELTKAIKLDPNLPLVWNNRGVAYYNKGNNDRAIADLTQAIKLDPNYAAAYCNRANAYSNKKDTDRAIADMNQAIKLDPNFAVLYINRGIIYFNKGDFDKAIVDLSRGLELDSTQVIVYSFRGVSYYQQGDYNKAVSDLEKALKNNPGDTNIKEWLEEARKARVR
jgi:tetratricopeptide (TPR) repeat protein